MIDRNGKTEFMCSHPKHSWDKVLMIMVILLDIFLVCIKLLMNSSQIHIC